MLIYIFFLHREGWYKKHSVLLIHNFYFLQLTCVSSKSICLLKKVILLTHHTIHLPPPVKPTQGRSNLGGSWNRYSRFVTVFSAHHSIHIQQNGSTSSSPERTNHPKFQPRQSDASECHGGKNGSLVTGFHLLSMVVSRVFKRSYLGKSKVSNIRVTFWPSQEEFKMKPEIFTWAT